MLIFTNLDLNIKIINVIYASKVTNIA